MEGDKDPNGDGNANYDKPVTADNIGWKLLMSPSQPLYIDAVTEFPIRQAFL